MKSTDPSTLLFIEPRNPPRFSRSASKKHAWFHQLLAEQQNTQQFGAYRNQTFELGTIYLGYHTCSCGVASAGYDILLPNRMATNSLAYHYLCYHTEEVPPEEWNKLEALRRFQMFNIIEREKIE